MLGKKNADELFKLAGALPSLRMRAAPSRVCQARTYTLAFQITTATARSRRLSTTCTGRY